MSPVKRYSAKTKAQILILIDWLGSKGYASATQAVMARNRLTHEELREWRSRMAQSGPAGLRATMART